MSITQDFAASANKVFEQLCDPDFLVDRCLALGELEAECEVEERGGETVITMRRTVERKLPAFLARLFNARQQVELVERWKGKGKNRHGSYTLRVLGQPVRVEATLELRPLAGGGCSYTVNHTARADIPLVGRRIEAFILDQTEDGARAELDYLADSLG